MFKDVLETVIEHTEGSLGALIMGIDGIAVERSLKQAGQEANLDVAAAEFTSLVRNAQKAGKDTGLGNLRELVVSLDDAVLLIRLLGQEYFVVLAISPKEIWVALVLSYERPSCKWPASLRCKHIHP